MGPYSVLSSSSILEAILIEYQDIGEMEDISKRMRSNTVDNGPPIEYNHKGVHYIRSDIAGFVGRQDSDAWGYGTRYIEVGDPTQIRGWWCGQEVCDSRFIRTKGKASTVADHLNNVHHVNLKKVKRGELVVVDNSEVASVESSDSSAYMKRWLFSLTQREFQDQLLRMFVIDQLPLSFADSPEFNSLLRLLCPQIEKASTSRRSIGRWVTEAYEEEKKKVRSLLKSAQSKIHLSYDGWSSPNGYSLFGVVAHLARWKEKNGVNSLQNQAILLGLKRMINGHTAVEQAKVLVDVIDDFDIGGQLGVFQSDNASVNDKTVEEVLSRLNITADAKERRARCLGHVINLAAREMLLGKDVDAFEFEIAGEHDVATQNSQVKLQAAQAAWQRHGAVGKLHNIVAFVRSSPQRLESFRRIGVGDAGVDDLTLKQDNSTRWSSHYSSIQRALQVRQRLEVFQRRHSDGIPFALLEESDWQQLETLKNALHPFYEHTRDLQSSATTGKHGSVWEWLPVIEDLLGHCEELKTQWTAQFGPSHVLVVAAQNAWQKLDKWYRLSDEGQLIFAAATLIAPRGRKAYFKMHWQANDMNSMINKVHQHWLQDYAGPRRLLSQPAPQREVSRLQRMLATKSTPTTGDPFLTYIEHPPTEHDVDPLDWWATAGPPALQSMAYDLLAIPAMSAETERVFSSAKQVLTPGRNRLTPEHVEELETLRNWWKGDIILQKGVESEVIQGGDDEV